MSHATTPVVTVLKRAIRAQLRVLTSELSAAVGGDAGAVHRSRVATRRLREALASLADLPGATRVRKDVRRVTRALGPVREMDVALVCLEAEAARAAWNRDAIAEVRRRVERERQRRSARLVRTRLPDLASVRARADHALAAAADPAALAPGPRALRKRIRRRAVRVFDAVAACGTLYVPERLHAVRIAVKKLRYALEIAQKTHTWPLDATLRALKRTQEQLGELHDLQVLLASVAAAAMKRRRSGLADGLRQMVETIERDCRTRHADLLPRLPALAAMAQQLDADLRPSTHGARPRMIRVSALVLPRHRARIS